MFSLMLLQGLRNLEKMNKKEILKDVMFYIACFLLGMSLAQGWVFLSLLCFGYMAINIADDISKL